MPLQSTVSALCHLLKFCRHFKTPLTHLPLNPRRRLVDHLKRSKIYYLCKYYTGVKTSRNARVWRNVYTPLDLLFRLVSGITCRDVVLRARLSPLSNEKHILYIVLDSRKRFFSLRLSLVSISLSLSFTSRSLFFPLLNCLSAFLYKTTTATKLLSTSHSRVFNISLSIFPLLLSSTCVVVASNSCYFKYSYSNWTVPSISYYLYYCLTTAHNT